MPFMDVLEEVELDDPFPGTTIKRFPKLKRLSVKEVNRRDTDRFCRTLSHWPNLEDLTILEAMMDPNFIKTCLPHLHTLPRKHLELRDLELDILLKRVLELLDVDIDPDTFYESTSYTARLVNLQAPCWRLPRTPERLTMEWQVQHKDALVIIGSLRNNLITFAFVDGIEWVRGVNGWYALDHRAAR
ncbi:hypothetical protein M407DRAFT_27729 [Tulasnella calospora MUT 4182]|uniref:F-box domain-containing protein n=1 Tax=Tulasnella calospora MUT 4182 TaxID=1051891 RepID=A0A0C3KN40_9AGAM|nr:hypothetical protein M407DRAFT_27729 [Tulasnella calospora MUT 4182]